MKLLQALKVKKYTTQTVLDFLLNPQNKVVILRHDVDRKPKNALIMARLENSLGVKASYYFRIVPESYNLEIMNKIAELGHEIGYHYEDVDMVINNYKLRIRNDEDYQKLVDLAYENFYKNLKMLRENFDVKTVCMHGSPRSKYDNKIIWEKYNYRDLEIICEPYFDVDYNEVFYLTDASRAWNNNKVNRRDRVNSDFKFDINSSKEFIKFIQSNNSPLKIMLNVHPHNWTNSMIGWTIIGLWQFIKNIAKRIIIKQSESLHNA
ncbi:MAG: hypothetical protein Q8N83_14400 [Ignavibacteria bacterium]|nr:hypothetical protein [Ignavibacteria bacterium]